MPVIYPRFSATIIENKIKKLLKKLNITDVMLESGKEETIKQIVGKMSEIDLEGLMLNLEKDIQTKLEELEKIFFDFEMNISDSFDRIKRNLKKEVKVLNKKLYSELKKQNEFIVESVNKIYRNIFPHGNLQEREINILSYLNKYDFGIMDDLYHVIKPLNFTHKFLEII